MIGNAGSKSSAQQAHNCSYRPSWWGRVRCTVGEDRIFLPFEWNAAEPCDQGFIGPPRRRSWRPDLYAALVWGVDGGHVPAGGTPMDRISRSRHRDGMIFRQGDPDPRLRGRVRVRDNTE
jgi:hypothetical protein